MSKELIEKIIDIEWKMFQQVNNVGGRASCQNNFQTFKIMRYSQFKAWGLEIQKSYFNDLNEALNENRNLLTEKYARMMKYTYPAEYEEIKENLPLLSEEKQNLIEEILKLNKEQEKIFANRYPKIRKLGRQDYSSKSATIDIYFEGEILTYSMETLKLLHKYLLNLKNNNESMAIKINECTAKIYGYASIDDMESKL